jgi:hypothetical protein
MSSNAPPRSDYTAAEPHDEDAPNESPNHAGEQDTPMIFHPQPSRGSSANSLLIQPSTYTEESRRLALAYIPDSDASSNGQARYSAFYNNRRMRLPSIPG